MSRRWSPGNVLSGIMLLALLAGCASLPFQLPRLLLPPTATPRATLLAPAPTQSAPATGGAQTPPQPGRTPPVEGQPPNGGPTQASGPQTLTIWLPPEFDPATDTAAARSLRQRLDAFEAAHPGVTVEARVKAASGPGGLLDALSAASAAAPEAVPALVAVARSDLESAALKGLVYSLDGLTQIMDDGDWYPFARELAQVQGSTFGLPFAGDALVLVYRPGRLGPAPASWDAILRLGQPVVFPVADQQGLFTLTLYRMLNGNLLDDQRRPVLQADVLTKALQLYADGAQQGAFPYWLAQVQTERQAWQAYRDGRAQWLVAWGSSYLEEMPADSVPLALPSIGEKPVTLATGWVWAISDPRPERRALSAELAEFLVQPDFLTGWLASARLLPPRPSAMTAWGEASLRGVFQQVALAAVLRPSNDQMAALGPALEIATASVIKRETDPVPAAQAAAERLLNPGTK